MINWLLFFPDQPRWIIICRFVLCSLFACIAFVSGSIVLITGVKCEGNIGVDTLEVVDWQIFQLLNALAIICVCVTDTYVHSIKHFADLSKKVVGCSLFLLSFIFLIASVLPPTFFFESYLSCNDVFPSSGLTRKVLSMIQ